MRTITHSQLAIQDNYQMDICPCNICPENICPYQQYLSCYWPDFDQIFKIGSWDNLELISTAMATFVQTLFVLATFVHIRNISADTDPILTKFKDRFLGPSLIYANCQDDICPVNICPGNICPYQEYYYWLWPSFLDSKFCQP